MTLSALLKSAGLEQPIRREIAVVPKVLDEKQGLVRFVASDATLDCYSEIVRPDGWQFTHFAKNAPFVNSHDYSDIANILGQVVAWKVEGGQLVEDVQFALTPGGQTFADWAFAMYRDGFLRACSVGFVPVAMATKWDSDKTALLAQIADLKLDPATAAKVAAIYIRQEQIELSACIIGANPAALAKSLRTIAAAYKAGTLTEQSVENLSALIARTKTAAPATDRSAAAAAHRSAQLALLAEIQTQLL